MRLGETVVDTMFEIAMGVVANRARNKRGENRGEVGYSLFLEEFATQQTSMQDVFSNEMPS